MASLGENPRDDDLWFLVQQVKARVTLDRNIKKPAGEVIRSTVSSALDPLRVRTGDDIQVVYADLSSLKSLRAAVRVVRNKRTDAVIAKPQEPVPAPVAQTLVPAAPPVILPAASTEINLFWPSLALIGAAAVVALGLVGGLSALARRLNESFFSIGESLREVVRLPEIFSQGLETLRATVAESRSQPVPMSQPMPFPIALVPTLPAAPPVPPPMLQAVGSESIPLPRVRPINSYALERQLNAKRKVLFQNPGAVARVLSRKFPHGGEEDLVFAGFLRSLAPKETEAMSRYLNADDLIRFSRLTSSAIERAGVNRLISFVDELGPEVAAQAGLTVPVARAVELIEKFDSEHLSQVVKECSVEVAAAILRGIPPEKREEVFARFEGPARESLLKQISAPTPADPATVVPAIVESAVRICVRGGLKDLLLLWVSESRTLLSKERHEALLLSIREEASGLMVDPRR